MPSLLFAASPGTVVLAALLLYMPASASAGLQVRFIDPENFTNARISAGGNGADTEILRVIERHLQDLADGCLRSDQTLEISVLDVDLAGRQEWWRNFGVSGTRVMRDNDWPRMEIAYRWQPDASASAPVERRERVTDMNYLLNSNRVRSDSRQLPYERMMLTRWFQRKFCSAEPKNAG